MIFLILRTTVGFKNVEKQNLLNISKVYMSKLEEAKDSHYISGPQFYQMILEYYAACEAVEGFTGDKDSKKYKELKKRERKALNECGKPILKMIKGLSNNAKFSGYTWKEEMVADAELKCTKALIGRKFKPCIERDGVVIKYNPFSYFNRIAWREFLHRNRVEKDHVDVRNKYIDEHRNDFKGDDSTIYIKPSFTSKLQEFYNDDYEILSEE